MSNEFFINTNKKAIRELLKEIGKERYEVALADARVADMKPLSLEGFYCEWKDGDIWLYHRYPSGTVVKIMSILGYWSVPEKGWELKRKILNK